MKIHLAVIVLACLVSKEVMAGGTKLITAAKPQVVKTVDGDQKYMVAEREKEFKVNVEGPLVLAIQVRAMIEGKLSEKTVMTLTAVRDSAFISENKLTLFLDNKASIPGKLGALVTRSGARSFEVPEGKHSYAFRLNAPAGSSGLFKVEIWKKKNPKFAASPEKPWSGPAAASPGDSKPGKKDDSTARASAKPGAEEGAGKGAVMIALKKDLTNVGPSKGKLDALTARPPQEKVTRKAGIFERQPVWTWVSLGIGAVSLGAGAGFGAMASSDRSKSAGEPVAVTSKKYYDRAKSNALTANIFYGVGAAALAGGAVLFFFSGEGD